MKMCITTNPMNLKQIIKHRNKRQQVYHTRTDLTSNPAQFRSRRGKRTSQHNTRRIFKMGEIGKRNISQWRNRPACWGDCSASERAQEQTLRPCFSRSRGTKTLGGHVIGCSRSLVSSIWLEAVQKWKEWDKWCLYRKKKLKLNLRRRCICTKCT